MRVSEYFNLDRAQETLDFVDVDVYKDMKLFVSPRALRNLESPWGEACIFLIQKFFSAVLAAISSDDNERAFDLLEQLREPNETHLGLSINRSQGSALGEELAEDVWNALTQSEAAKSGLIEDLEDTILLIPNVSHDRISDIATNIIRGPLISYTQQMCDNYGIEMTEFESGAIWNAESLKWEADEVMLPIIGGNPDFKIGARKLLLVPKAIVRRKFDYSSDEYYRHYVLEHFREIELSSNSELVKLLKNGNKKVFKKDLRKKYGDISKANAIAQTLRNPEILGKYKEAKKKGSSPMSNEDLLAFQGAPDINWDALLQELLDTPVGEDDFARFEKAVEKLLSALFYPSLVFPKLQRSLDEGRKRVDIQYTNMAEEGFFSWLSKYYTAPNIFIECKNYGNEVGNPELDQLAGRFTPSRGRFGILVCRKFKNKKLFLRRCQDCVNGGRGYIIPLDDSDFIKLVEVRKDGSKEDEMRILKDLFDEIIM